MLERVLNIPPLPTNGATRESDADGASIFPTNIHICHFYKNKRDLLELLVPYFQEGLRKNEFCLWGVADPLSVPTATQALDAAMGGDLGSYIRGGQIEIFDVSAFYGTQSFDAMAVKDAFLAKVKENLDKGWRAFRCDGLASGLAPGHWRNFQTYEAEITRGLQPHITALCSYDLSKLTAENVMEVVSTHQASLVKRTNGWCVLESAEHVIAKEARRKEMEFRELADHMSPLAWMANAYGVLTWFNRRWHDYTGVSEAHMRSKDSTSVFDPEQWPTLRLKWKESIETGRSFEISLSLRGADGVYRQFLTRAMPLRDQNGKVTRWFGTCTDLSELTSSVPKTAS